MPSSHTSSDCSAKSSSDLASLPSCAVYTPPLYYQLIIGLLEPLYRLQVWRRSHQRDNYQQEVEQRFGKRYPARPLADATRTTESQANKGVIWCHAVSLGETNTVAPLLEALLAEGYEKMA